ncbi:MAG: carotenoid biosynthesis protein, partial [Burkholderiaceae bacterium]
REPVLRETGWPKRILTAWLAAMIVTAFDLGADPYFVFVLHAWVMQKTDGGWFGETLQGFVGWMIVSFAILMLAQWRVRPQQPAGDAAKQRKAALVPMLLYGSGLVFQMLFGSPIEIKAVAFFAMGLPLTVALAAWWPWRAAAVASKADVQPWPLEAMAMQADPLADQAISRIVGPWPEGAGQAGAPPAAGMARLGQATRCMGQWTLNGDLTSWAPQDPGTDPTVAAALREYLRKGSALPEWADRAKVERAEDIFMSEGPLSCTLLFCASLPQCYVLPWLAEVLHTAGQLEAHTEYRIRQTAAMIFPVMMKGGLMDPSGSGVAQVLKVRLVHASIRHLILHGDPEQVDRSVPGAAANAAPAQDMQSALLAHGWDLDAGGLPCSQFELAYTLLTFGYVFLDGMRKMGLALSHEDEEACLHTWNVMGHVLGMRPELMAHTMEEASALFGRMQAYGRSHALQPDPRPPLGQALMNAMAAAIRIPVIRSLPVPMTQWLLGPQASKDIGLAGRVPWLVRFVFNAGRLAIGCIDGIGQLFWSGFSVSRVLTRVVGYHLLTRFLLDQTRPIGLPDHVLNPMQETVAGWDDDARSPGWLNRLEDRLTTRGAWTGTPSERRPA